MIGGTKEVVDLRAGGDSGEFEALISTYGEVDSYRQRIKSGEAFERVAGAINRGDVVIPVVWQHEIRDPWLYVGEVKQADTTRVGKHGKAGLGIAGVFDVDESKTAAQAFRQVKGGRIPNWSYRWSGTATKADDGVDELADMWIHEVSPVLEGALSSTHTLGVKSFTPAEMRAEVERLLSGVRELVPAGLEGLKSYVDVDVPGSYEAVQGAIGDALRVKYPPSTKADEWGPYTTVVATLTDRVAYQVCGSDGDRLFWADYEFVDGEVKLGEPKPATVSLSGAAEAADPPEPVKAPRSPLEVLIEVERRAAPLL